MSVVAPTERPAPEELELLIREARARQRRRRAIAAAFAAALAGSAIAAYAVAGATTTRASGTGKSSAATLPRCRADQLRLSAPTALTTAAGSLLQPMTLTNVSGSDCSLAGWPTVRRLDSAGRVIPARTFRYTYDGADAVPFHTLAVRPGHSSSFNFFAPDWNHAADRPCANARVVEVEPPGDHNWLSVVSKIPACAVLYVDPLVTGSTDARWGTVGGQHFGHP